MFGDQEGQEKLRKCVDPVNLEFIDLRYAPKNKREKSHVAILKSISGKFYSGKLTAILGPSGAGKSSLLNVLSGMKTKDVKGDIMTNGRPRCLQEFRTQCCYITHEFALLPLLTARETLKIAADLKLGSTVNGFRKNCMISEILDSLGLSHVSHNQVRSLSGGEKKRLSIGLEMITNPPVMLFDEPTSGLDSTSALQVISHLKELALGGRTIVCIIHQPSSKLYEMFDDIYVMSQGHCIYKGPAKNVISYFGKFGISCSQYYNPADFVIEIACMQTDHSLDTLVHNQNEQQLLVSQNSKCNGDLSQEFNVDVNHSQEHTTTFAKVGILLQFWILLKRSFLCTSRHSHMAWIRTIAHFVVGLLLGAVYYNIGDDAGKFTSNMACLFFFILFLFFANSMPTVLAVPMEAAVFYREHLNNWYSLPAYLFAKLVSDIPFQIICPSLFLVCSYFLTGQPVESSRLLQIWFIGLLIVILGQTKGLVIGAACDAQLGVFLVAASAIPMLLFSGFFLRLQDIPVYFKLFSYISYFRYSFEATMLSVYDYNRTGLICEDIYCPLRTPAQILEHMGMTDSEYGIDVVALIVWIVFLQLAFFCMLKWRLYQLR